MIKRILTNRNIHLIHWVTCITLLMLLQLNFSSDSFNFCGSMEISSSLLHLNSPGDLFNISTMLAAPSNGNQMSFSFFFKLNEMTSNELSFLGITMEDPDTQNNLNNLVKIHFSRNPNEASNTDGIQFEFPTEVTKRKKYSLDHRMNVGIWHFVLVSFDFQNKKRFIFVHEISEKSQNKFFREVPIENVDIEFKQSYTLSKSYIFNNC